MSARLANQPELLLKLELMAKDRASLQSLEEPFLAEDLVASLEPVLARPMLMGHESGQYRRVLRQRTRWPQMAIAAGLVLLVGIGSIAWLSGVLNQGGSRDSDLALLPAPQTPQHQSPLGDLGHHEGDLHHLEPGPWPREVRLADADTPNESSSTEVPWTERLLLSGAAAVEADFILEIRSASEADLLSGLTSTFSSSSGSGLALVRTFTYDDAQRVWNELVAGSNLREERELLLTSLRGHRAGAAYTPQQRENIHRVVRANSKVTLGERLFGQDANTLAPDDQLRLGEDGADFAMVLSTDGARTLLERLLADSRWNARLRSTDADNQTSEPNSAWDSWKDWAAANEMFARLEIMVERGAERVIIPIERR